MTDTTIRLSEGAKARLERHKRPDESYDDVIRRLTERDKWAGFGVLADAEGDVREGLRRVREEMNDAMAEDIAAMGRRHADSTGSPGEEDAERDATEDDD